VPIDLQNVFWRSAKLPKDIASIQGFSQSIGGGKKPVVEKNSAGKILGDRNKNLKRIDVRFSFKGGFASVRETTVTISGSVPWEMSYRVLARLVPEIKLLKFKITNTAVKFYLKKVVKLDRIIDEKRKGPGYTLEYEPELYPGLRIKFSDGVLVNVFGNGTVTAQGRDLTGIEKRVKDVFAMYKNPYGENRPRIPIAARKNLAKKRENIIESRYEPAKGWTNSRSGFYVRPGPNKAARFYAIPSNPALVRTKVIRAYANIGVNVPPLTRRILGIVNVSKPKPKVVKKKTVNNWNTSPPVGMYVRPGPGGLPKFYKIPKLLKQGKKTVIDTYKKAAIRIPNRVRTVFGISPSPNKSPSPAKLLGNVSNKGVFRIDGLDCMRYKLPELKRIAEKLDIPIGRRSKEYLCRDIRSKLMSEGVPKTNKINFIKNGVKHYILVNSRAIKRNSRTKSLDSFKIQDIKNFIKEMNSGVNLSKPMKKNELISLLIERKRTKNVLNSLFNFSPSSSEASSSASSISSANGSPIRNPLNIARNILGPNFTNTELQNFLNRYKKSPNRLNKIVNEFKIRKKIHSSSPAFIRGGARANVETL
jgi:hypothetical protein